MKSYAQFKKEQNVDKIEFFKGKGRAFATVNNVNLIIGSKTDMSKETFVTPLGLGEGIEGVREGWFVVVNSSMSSVGAY